jgi:hypothetical protein
MAAGGVAGKDPAGTRSRARQGRGACGRTPNGRETGSWGGETGDVRATGLVCGDTGGSGTGGRQAFPANLPALAGGEFCP